MIQSVLRLVQIVEDLQSAVSSWNDLLSVVQYDVK
jgi:hypothetical protein